MSEFKILDINKAENLCLTYKKHRHYAKERFLGDLIDFQYFFGNESIVNVNILLTTHYTKKTVQSVLADLDYKLILYSAPKQEDLCGISHGRSTKIRFVPNKNN